ncbi:MAG: dihydrolipoamide acetyltransferase family protein, partial [Candidatus Bathyarchaeia archaeon]
MQQVVMPKLGLTMETGRIVKWLKKEGEKVMRDEAIVEIETEKVTMSIESPAEGILAKIIAMEGQEVSVSKPIAILTSEGETIPNSLEAPTVEKEPMREPQELAPITTSVREEPRISPLARKIAEENGIDVSKLRGTGPDGRVVREDVLKAIEDGKRAASKDSDVSQDIRIENLSGLRKNVAERMTLSSQTIPQVTLQTEADLTETVNFHQDYAAKTEKAIGVHVTFTDVIVKAAAKALQEYPRFNSTFLDNGIRFNENINVGIAVAVDSGLIVPIVHDADKTALTEIAKTSKELADKARLGKLTI